MAELLLLSPSLVESNWLAFGGLSGRTRPNLLVTMFEYRSKNESFRRSDYCVVAAPPVVMTAGTWPVPRMIFLKPYAVVTVFIGCVMVV
jgi:hypothetical protein